MLVIEVIKLYKLLCYETIETPTTLTNPNKSTYESEVMINYKVQTEERVCVKRERVNVASIA
ncbi:hypothetical protein Ahy_A05g023129 isoform C [Arachis hypogaea]|uniref:Uncharacterized protein n=1 Tax=Arachis hypogaea TaxID=3818 RepID=A0A445D316_ARAHY|nr:hypothetical protein Ahy_A05g023129 isoform C [Arachis hypogaea]